MENTDHSVHGHMIIVKLDLTLAGVNLCTFSNDNIEIVLVFIL